MNKRVRRLMNHLKVIQLILLSEASIYTVAINQKETDSPWATITLQECSIGECFLFPLIDYCRKQELGLTISSYKDPHDFKAYLSIEILLPE